MISSFVNSVYHFINPEEDIPSEEILNKEDASSGKILTRRRAFKNCFKDYAFSLKGERLVNNEIIDAKLCNMILQTGKTFFEKNEIQFDSKILEINEIPLEIIRSIERKYEQVFPVAIANFFVATKTLLEIIEIWNKNVDDQKVVQNDAICMAMINATDKFSSGDLYHFFMAVGIKAEGRLLGKDQKGIDTLAARLLIKKHIIKVNTFFESLRGNNVNNFFRQEVFRNFFGEYVNSLSNSDLTLCQDILDIGMTCFMRNEPRIDFIPNIPKAVQEDININYTASSIVANKKIPEIIVIWKQNASEKNVAANAALLRAMIASTSIISSGELYGFFINVEIKPEGALLDNGKTVAGHMLIEKRSKPQSQLTNAKDFFDGEEKIGKLSQCLFLTEEIFQNIFQHVDIEGFGKYYPLIQRHGADSERPEVKYNFYKNNRFGDFRKMLCINHLISNAMQTYFAIKNCGKLELNHQDFIQLRNFTTFHMDRQMKLVLPVGAQAFTCMSAVSDSSLVKKLIQSIDENSISKKLSTTRKIIELLPEWAVPIQNKLNPFLEEEISSSMHMLPEKILKLLSIKIIEIALDDLTKLDLNKIKLICTEINEKEKFATVVDDQCIIEFLSAVVKRIETDREKIDLISKKTVISLLSKAIIEISLRNHSKIRLYNLELLFETIDPKNKVGIQQLNKAILDVAKEEGYVGDFYAFGRLSLCDISVLLEGHVHESWFMSNFVWGFTDAPNMDAEGLRLTTGRDAYQRSDWDKGDFSKFKGYNTVFEVTQGKAVKRAVKVNVSGQNKCIAPPNTKYRMKKIEINAKWGIVVHLEIVPGDEEIKNWPSTTAERFRMSGNANIRRNDLSPEVMVKIINDYYADELKASPITKNYDLFETKVNASKVHL